MDVYQELKAWLTEDGTVLDIDHCGRAAGSVGLLPQGVQVLRQWEDVLGNRYRKARYSFLLRLVAPPGELTVELLQLIDSEAAKRGYTAQNGKLVKAASDGLAIYEIRLTAEREEQL